MVVRVTADIASTAGARADIMQRLFHRSDDLGVLPHRQVIVRAPHGDRLRAVMPRKAARVGVGTLVAQDVDENAVTTFGMQTLDRGIEDLIVVHPRLLMQWPCLAMTPPMHGVAGALRRLSHHCQRHLGHIPRRTKSLNAPPVLRSPAPGWGLRAQNGGLPPGRSAIRDRVRRQSSGQARAPRVRTGL